MNEKSVTAKTRKHLTARGFLCVKFNDKSTIGIPDMTVCKRGITLWVEDKIIFKDDLPKALFASEFIKKERTRQLLFMCELERKAIAEYWVYCVVGKDVFIARLSPIQVFYSFEGGTPLTNLIWYTHEQWCTQFSLDLR